MNSQSFKPLLSAAVLTSFLATSAVAAQHTNEPKAKPTTPAAMPKDKATTDKAGTTKPTAVLLVVPLAYATDEKLGNGCWARMYDGGNYTGSQYTLVGPVDVPAMRDGLGLNEKYDSIVVGPKATLTVYDNINYRDKAATLKPASRTPDLDDKMQMFETIRSLKITCAT